MIKIKPKLALFIVMIIFAIVWFYADYNHVSELNKEWPVVHLLAIIVSFIYGYIIGNPKYD